MDVEGLRDLGRYRLMSRIGKGGMAEIYVAKLVGALGFEKLLVIKRILPHLAADPGFVSMFVTEAKLVCQLVHPNIVQVFEFGEADGEYFIAMEHVEGIDGHRLWKTLALRRERLPAALALHIVGEALKGLDHAHRAMGPDGTLLGVVHRDVSPSNLLISWRGDVKIGDFGIAHVRQESKSQAGALKGKFGYMTPEQLAGLEVDHRSDVFSAGTVLAELLTGVRLFFGKSDFETMRNVIEVKLGALEAHSGQLDPEVLAIVERALQRDPRDRYPSAGEFQEAIADYLYRHGHRPDSQMLAAFVAEHVAPHLAAEPAPATPSAEISATAPPVDLEHTQRVSPESLETAEVTTDLLLEGSSMDFGDETTSPQHQRDTAIELGEPSAGEPPDSAPALSGSTSEETPFLELVPLHEVTLGERAAAPAPVSAERPPVSADEERLLEAEPEEGEEGEESEEELEIDDRPLVERLAEPPRPSPPQTAPPRAARPTPAPAARVPAQPAPRAPAVAPPPPSLPAAAQPMVAAPGIEDAAPTVRVDLRSFSVVRALSRLTRGGETGLVVLRGPALAGRHRELLEQVATIQARAGVGRAQEIPPSRTCALHLQRGVPDLVSADRSEETLVAHLLRSGVVRENQLALAFRDHRELRPIGALLAAGAITTLQVSRQVSSFVSWSFFESFAWREGELAFYRGAACPPGGFPTGQLGPELLAKAVSYLPEPLFEHYFSPFLAVGVSARVPPPQQPAQFENLPLVVEVYREALNPTTVGALCARGDRREQLRRRRALYLLIECELCQLR
jgi:serine/threonine-protein kinase